MMPSLDDHFRALTTVRPPSDWPEREALRLRSVPSPRELTHPDRLRTRPFPGEGHRLAAAAVAFAVAAAGIGFAIWAFIGAPDSPQPRPAATVENGKIAFVRAADQHNTIDLVDPDGSDPIPLIRGSSPAWSPDGTTLGFVEEPASENARYLATVSADGSDVERLVRLEGQPGGIGPQAWSPDGTRLVYASYDGIHIVGADGSGSQRVTHYEGQHACSDLHPSWAPSGDRIVFAVLCEGGNEGLWTINVDGSDRRRLIGGDYEDEEYRSPVWSPDGREVAFVKTDWALRAPIKGAAIFVVNADGTGATRVASGAAFDRSLAWSPDGRALAFTGYHEGGSDILSLDLGSGEVTQITQTGNAADPAWQPVPVEDEAPSEGAGEWHPIPGAPEGWYRPEGAFWIDGRLVVVAASTIEAWDPQTDAWEVLLRIPQAEECEGCGSSEAAVWTGDEILLWGGGFSYLAEGSQSAGAAFDPRSGRLRALPQAPISARWWHTGVWTGVEMIVWGGACGEHECRDGAAYDPASDSWRAIADGPLGGYAHSVVWTGEEMIVWGGSDDYEAEGSFGYPRRFLDTGFAYDPASDSWRELARAPLEPRGWHSAVWTGREMIVWGGVRSPCTTTPCESYPADAAAYDPVVDTWRQIAWGPLSGRVDHSAVWTGEHMIVWGGSPPGGGLAYDDGALYNLEADSWMELPPAPIEGRYRHTALWTGIEMIIWGGQPGGGGPFADGAVFRVGV